ncbi:phenylalanine--tRNA ligase subunit alpha [Lacihabitans soyangensis]|uniref:Phenylalanine--tRNA ligase alpha subunit n=1 Tax=Lacihabitans soyangensis TaxID=869394 RepID=A0AAE3GZC4_9BACT|nr:phenylalanine--tRNA ligase subunit alpha [Lacihabitans soyangensis]MCP9762094.1 phenylalanine--tRNA ligase subunit alpha [Lacihabitans soyangensis]
MIEKIENIFTEVEQFLLEKKLTHEDFRLKYLSRKGVLNELFEDFKKISGDQKRLVGQTLNNLKNRLEEVHVELSANNIANVSPKNQSQVLDLTLPEIQNQIGSLHPLSIVRQKIVEIFARMGFNTEDGPEIETDWYNFSALNFAENHPAREMQDTFFVEKNEVTKDDLLLRTHTSNVQIRLMEYKKPPIRSIMVGRVYRNEAISARAHCQFHQVEGLYVDKNVSFKDLKDTLFHFAKEMFGKDTKIRLRPSYFPFTEPSAEIDITCFICHGDGCNICKHSGWVEIAGSGMVDPNVLANCNIDPEEYTGFAFGMGIERITMLKYGINDLRLFFENDVRFLKQFNGL